ncbi:MAG: cell division protein FtsZ, partial [Sedimenticola sp.]|nr:cell division protein FtsZ [Sedimenticola sp.]
FACDDATVVVGTVIDPDMTDELRVTVVATGLGAISKAVAKPPVVEEVVPVRLVNSDVVAPGPADYREMDSPTVVRKAAKSYVEAAQEHNMDYLDIPAFLRRQAD